MRKIARSRLTQATARGRAWVIQGTDIDDFMTFKVVTNHRA